MKHIFAILVASLILGILPSAAKADESPAGALLLGTWRHQKLQQVADGKLVRNQENQDGATLQFKGDATWILSSPRNNSFGVYRLLNDGSLETTTVKSDIPNQIGWISVKNIQVDSRSLRLTTVYDENGMKAFKPSADGTRPKSMTVTSIFERVVGK